MELKDKKILSWTAILLESNNDTEIYQQYYDGIENKYEHIEKNKDNLLYFHLDSDDFNLHIKCDFINHKILINGEIISNISLEFFDFFRREQKVIQFGTLKEVYNYTDYIINIDKNSKLIIKVAVNSKILSVCKHVLFPDKEHITNYI